MVNRKFLDLSLVLACYNEEPVFAGSIKRIIDILELSQLTYEIIFVDDASRDTTATLIKQACKTYPQCHAFFHTQNTGRGKTVSDGFDAAKGAVVGYIDFDLEVSPVYIPQMVQMILTKQADCVVGKRIYRTSFSSLAREFYSIGYQRVSDWLVGTGGIDTESGYKFFRRTKVLQLLAQTKHPHWFWDTEIMVFAKRAGLKITELPVLFLRRFDKQSSVNIVRDIMDYTVSLWTLRQRLIKESTL